MEDKVAATDPFPLVPATWIQQKLFWGFPRAFKMLLMVSRPSMIPNLLRPYMAFKQLWYVSLGDMRDAYKKPGKLGVPAGF